MDILIVMFVAAVAGRLAVPDSWRPYLAIGQNGCTVVLIFCMGSSMGSTEGFFQNLAVLGVQSLVCCLCPMVLSIALVYIATRRLADGGSPRDGACQARAGRPLAHVDPVVVMTFAALLAGLAVGALGADSPFVAALSSVGNLVLTLLMALVGMSMGMHRGLVSSIREHHVKMLIIPIGVVAGSLVGGAVAGIVCGLSVREGMAIAGGLGWYSLAGITIEGLVGAQAGGIAFLSNLLRELLSFFSIPWIARRLNGYACIAAGAATSEDTTLPMIIRYTDEVMVVFSILNGVICSALVPVLIAFLLA